MIYLTCSEARLMLKSIFLLVSTSRKGEPSPQVMYCLLWIVRVLHRSTVAVTSQVEHNDSQATKAYSTHTDLLNKVFCLSVCDSRRTQVDLATTNQSLIWLDMHKHDIVSHAHSILQLASDFCKSREIAAEVTGLKDSFFRYSIYSFY